MPELTFRVWDLAFPAELCGATASEAIWRFEFRACDVPGSAGFLLAFGDNSDENIAGVSEIDSLDTVTNEN